MGDAEAERCENDGGLHFNDLISELFVCMKVLGAVEKKR
jgi:hypothetical protein